MERQGPVLLTMGTDSQDSDDLVPPGTTGLELDTSSIQLPKPIPDAPQMSKKGIENAKKRLRAFSIQKKTPIAPVVVPKPVNTGSTTVLIGKLSSVKTTPKPEPEPDAKKIPKPPKPGGSRKNLQDSYTDLQKRTLAEIEDMKRKMELVELGIPLGLICPSSTSDKAMPTKAMPPIKSFLDATKVDELIREAKKAKAEGREFKFDYQKLLPDYDNPFQRKREDPIEKEIAFEEERLHSKSKSSRDRKDSRKSDKYDRRHSDHKKDDRDKDRYKSKDRERIKAKEKEKVKEEAKKVEEVAKEKPPKETDVNLNDYLVCDSWSLDNDDKNTASPKVDSKNPKLVVSAQIEKAKNAAELVKESLKLKKDKTIESPKPKIEKLKPVIDSFKFEIDPNEDEALDIFDEDTDLEKFSRPTSKKDPYDSPIDLKLFDYDQDMSKEGVIDANDDNFLESVINEIKQENMDDSSQDKGLVEYDLSPKDDYDDSRNDASQGSVTPELDDRMRDLQSSQHSHYSDGYRSNESGYKSTESGYKSTESSYKSGESGFKPKKGGYKLKESGYRPDSRQSNEVEFRLSVEKELDEALLSSKMTKSTVDSLETWSFVLKICQPLLFRHDKNKCYKETHTTPKIWYTENPKGCNCVKDRFVVYEELEMCKMGLVDRVYGCDQIPDEPFPDSRTWYPRITDCDASAASLPLASEWETEDAHEPVSKSLTPQRDGRDGRDICLDREYQKFMEAVWPEVTDKPASRSTTPVRQDTRKKKKTEDVEKESEDRKKTKKVKLSSEGWSQESDLEDEVEKTKKIKQEKGRKRKHSTSSSSTLSDSEEDSRKKRKVKKKGNKKLKAKLAKKRRISKKLKKQLKEKQKKKKKLSAKVQDLSDDTDELREKKKAKKKKQLQQKRLLKKKKSRAKSTSSSSSTSSSETDSDVERRKKIKKKEMQLKKKKKDRKRRQQSTDSSQSEELFDVNVLNNIKTERLTDDEKIADFSPRRQKPREIINVKELQNDFVGSNIHIKQEKIEEPKQEVQESPVQDSAVQSLEEQRPVQAVEKLQEEEMEIEEKAEVQETAVPKPAVQPVAEETSSEPPSVQPLPVQPPPVQQPPLVQQPSPVRATAVQPTAVQTTAVQPTAVQPTAVQTTAVQTTAVQPTAVQPTAVQTTAVQTTAVQPTAVQPTAVQKPVIEVVVDRKPKQVEITNSFVEIPSFNIDESHLIPLPEEPMSHSLDDIAMPPEKPIEIVETSNIKAISSDYAFETSQSELYHKGLDAECEDKFSEAYTQDYEIYEQMALAYQSDVANKVGEIGLTSEIDSVSEVTQRIETVVRRRGEIKCDWRAGDSPAAVRHHRPSRWGLKPGEVNIVLTGGPSSASSAPPPGPPPVAAVPPGGGEGQAACSPQQYRIRSVLEPMYEIRSLANRSDSAIGYDEAYMDTYGAADRLQYGDCFSDAPRPSRRITSLDDRISEVLRETVLGEVAKETDDVDNDKDTPEKGILVTKSLEVAAGRGSKRVSFADGYRPGQDSDVEEPPVKKKKKQRRYGCAWPCPAAHADHVPLWDALPPPPPPPGSPPPPAAPAPPLHLLRARPPPAAMPPLAGLKIDPTSLPPFIPPEPPQGLINFP